MISKFLLYLYTLPQNEQTKELFIFLIFFLVLFFFSTLLDFILSKNEKGKIS